MVPMNSSMARVRSARGAELIEFALVMPLLLLVVFGIADFGFMFQRYEVLTNATREGARLAVLSEKYGETDVKRRVCAYLAAGGVPTTGCPTNPSNPVVAVTNTTVDMGLGAVGLPLQAKRVQLTYTHSYMFIGGIVNLFSGSPSTEFPITTVAIMRREIAE